MPYARISQALFDLDIALAQLDADIPAAGLPKVKIATRRTAVRREYKAPAAKPIRQQLRRLGKKPSDLIGKQHTLENEFGNPQYKSSANYNFLPVQTYHLHD